MKRESDYKGYHIVSRLAGRWFAQVFPPGSHKALSEIPSAKHGEDYEHLLTLAHDLIDHQPEKKAAGR